MTSNLASGADNISDIGLMLKVARLAEASKESEIRMRFARDVAAPLLAKILVEGGEGLSSSTRLSIAYDIISSLDVPCGCDVVVLTTDELVTKKEVPFIKSMLQERALVYGTE